MPAKKRPGVRVRGSCKAGHVTETTSDPGRLTAEGECSHAGCEEHVRMKRIPKDLTAPASTDTGGTRVVRIADYDATASGAQGDDGGLVVADIDPAPVGSAGGPPAGADDGPTDPLGEHGERRTLSERWRDRRRRSAVRSARREYQHPLGI